MYIHQPIEGEIGLGDDVHTQYVRMYRVPNKGVCKAWLLDNL